MTALVQTAPRVCESCDARFERRRFPSGQLERLSQFAKRRFCSRECYRKASAEGSRIRPVGERIDQPYGLFAPASPFDLQNGRLASGTGYPWARQRGATGAAFPAPFSTGREMPVSEPHREDRS